MSNKGRQLLLWWSKQDNIVVQNFDRHDLNRNWNREKWVWRIDFRLGSSCLDQAESTFMRQFFCRGWNKKHTAERFYDSPNGPLSNFRCRYPRHILDRQDVENKGRRIIRQLTQQNFRSLDECVHRGLEGFTNQAYSLYF